MNQTNCLFEHRKKTTAYNGPPTDTTRGGEYIRCSSGHTESSITRGYDPKKRDYYIEARCHHAGCSAEFKTYDKERREKYNEL